jgi:hypothetical protein
MKISTHAINRLSQAVAVLLVAAGLVVPVAAAAGKQPPDAFQRAVARHEAQVQAPTRTLPDVIERFAAMHPYGLGLTAPPTIVVHTSPGFSWGAAAMGAFGAFGIALAATGIAMYARASRTRHSSPAV